MATEQLRIHKSPQLAGGSMVLGFSGWMDGGEVSTGTVELLTSTLGAERIAEIAPRGFYIYNFPGSMEISALFRPHVKLADGLIERYDLPTNTFHCDARNSLVLFSGKEPNFNWEGFAECLLVLASKLDVRRLFFVGSYAGMVPHTRDPRLTSTVSDESLKPLLEQYGIRPANYEGPASFATYLVSQARRHNMSMATLVAEIPAYVQGPNPKCIGAVVRKLAALLGLPLNLDALASIAEDWERRLNDLLQGKPDLASHIRKLEEDYDNEVFDTQMGDLKDWLQQQGIRVD